MASVTLPNPDPTSGAATGNIQASALVGSNLYMLAQSNGIIKWTNPSGALGTWTAASLPVFNGTTVQATFMLFDSTLGKLLVSCVDSSGISTDLLVYTCDPTTLAFTLLVDDSTVAAPSPRAIASDGTNLYTWANVSGTSQIRKYLLSTGAFVSSASPFGAGYNFIDTMTYDSGTSRIYVAGRHTTAPAKLWAGYITTSLASSAQIDITDFGVASPVDEESCLLGGFFWFTVENNATSLTLIKVAADISSYSRVDTGVVDKNYGCRSDGTNVVCTLGTDPSPSYVLWVNPSTNAITGRTQITTNGGGSDANTSVFDSTHSLYYVAIFSSSSIVSSIPMGSPPNTLAAFLRNPHTSLPRVSNIEQWLTSNTTYTTSWEPGLDRLGAIEDFLRANPINATTFVDYRHAGTDRIWAIEEYLLSVSNSGG